ncbi:ABC transporter permease [Radiobacillus sp. PE A8.2]|uniref:ABC transporter permease n=1 Tax=Radiobacillus sp. PE A8.2 TaxID=3380349 RepID=UPI00388EF434
MKTKKVKIVDISLHIATFLTVIFIWEAVVRIFDISSSIFPSGIETVFSFFSFFFNFESIEHLWATFSETMLGFLLGSLGGAILGILVAEIKWMKNHIFPYLVALNSIPKMALAPLFIVWFGFGISSKVAMVMISTFFPVLINMIVGMDKIDANQIKLMKAYSASKWQVFRRVKLPGSLPYLFSGLEIAIIFGVIGAVVAEFVGADKGLGFLMLFYNARFEIDDMFAILGVISLMGYLLLLAVQKASKKIVFWQGNDNKK